MNEIKNLEDIKKLTTEFLNALKPAKMKKIVIPQRLKY